MDGRLLLVDDDDGVREILGFQLREAGVDVTAVADGESALAAFSPGAFDLVLTDVRMPGMSGLELLAQVRELDPEVEVILISAYADVEKAVEAMRTGASDYLTKPVKRRELEVRVGRCIERSRLRRENRRLRHALGADPLAGIEGVSRQIAELKALLRRLATSDATVLVTGESGTGKELAARAIHAASDRRDGPFVTVNCGAIPADLLESELFGHERGAFSGAVRQQKGRIERANGGTLLLDEVGELRLDHQVKLLRVLQEHQVERLGGDRVLPVDVRFVAATHRDLRRAVRDGAFREDLYYRLAVLLIEIPPLRERPADVRALARHFLARHPDAREVHMAPELEEALVAYPWPGNVRELQNALERMVLLRRSDRLGPGDFRPDPLDDGAGADGATPAVLPGRVRLPDAPFSLPDLEREIIEEALRRNDGNRSKTARFLGIPRHVLLYRLEKYGLTG